MKYETKLVVSRLLIASWILFLLVPFDVFCKVFLGRRFHLSLYVQVQYWDMAFGEMNCEK